MLCFMLFILTVCVACEAGHFGPGCQKLCRCEHGAPCEHITGVCLCPPGWRGLHCEKSQFTYPSPLSVTRSMVTPISLEFMLHFVEFIVALSWPPLVAFCFHSMLTWLLWAKMFSTMSLCPWNIL